jgi:hypothetical protein
MQMGGRCYKSYDTYRMEGYRLDSTLDKDHWQAPVKKEVNVLNRWAIIRFSEILLYGLRWVVRLFVRTCTIFNKYAHNGILLNIGFRTSTTVVVCPPLNQFVTATKVPESDKCYRWTCTVIHVILEPEELTCLNRHAQLSSVAGHL